MSPLPTTKDAILIFGCKVAVEGEDVCVCGSQRFFAPTDLGNAGKEDQNVALAILIGSVFISLALIIGAVVTS